MFNFHPRLISRYLIFICCFLVPQLDVKHMTCRHLQDDVNATAPLASHSYPSTARSHRSERRGVIGGHGGQVPFIMSWSVIFLHLKEVFLLCGAEGKEKEAGEGTGAQQEDKVAPVCVCVCVHSTGDDVSHLQSWDQLPGNGGDTKRRRVSPRPLTDSGLRDLAYADHPPPTHTHPSSTFMCVQTMINICFLSAALQNGHGSVKHNSTSCLVATERNSRLPGTGSS